LGEYCRFSAEFKFANVPEIVIEDELLAPDKIVIPAVDPKPMAPSATESETESERPAAAGSVRMI
jgi:hypothetical protein